MIPLIWIGTTNYEMTPGEGIRRKLEVEFLFSEGTCKTSYKQEKRARGIPDS